MRRQIGASNTLVMNLELIIHTTCDVEFEIIEAKTGKVIRRRGYVCDEGDEEAEEAVKRQISRWCEQNGHKLVGEVWS